MRTVGCTIGSIQFKCPSKNCTSLPPYVFTKHIIPKQRPVNKRQKGIKKHLYCLTGLYFFSIFIWIHTNLWFRSKFSIYYAFSFVKNILTKFSSFLLKKPADDWIISQQPVFYVLWTRRRIKLIFKNRYHITGGIPVNLSAKGLRNVAHRNHSSIINNYRGRIKSRRQLAYH